MTPSINGPQTVWLSGPIMTFLNKIVFPAIWAILLAGIPVFTYTLTGRFSVGSDFRFIGLFVILSVLPLGWLTAHLQNVGYRGRELVIKNYWREEAIRFEDIEAVEPVWWYRGRLVRVRLRRETQFGNLVYYMPKWAPLKTMFSHPERELREIIGSPGLH